MKIIIPAGTFCDDCEEAKATAYNSHDGWIPPSFYCQSCLDDRERAYELPSAMDVYPQVVMNEHGRIF